MSSLTEEIQSAYWNASSVASQPTVVYYNGKENDLEHMYFIFVSDVLNHSAAAVLTIMKMLTAELTERLAEATHIEYLTDSLSPTIGTASFLVQLCITLLTVQGFFFRLDGTSSNPAMAKGRVTGLVE